MLLRKFIKGILTFSFIIIFGCDNSKKIAVEFEKEFKIRANRSISIDEVYIRYPKICNLTDSTFIIISSAMGYSSGSHLAYVCSKETGKIVKKLAKEGRGPKEMLAINNVSFLKNEVLFYDAISRKILHYDYVDDVEHIETLKFKRLYSERNLFLIDENTFVSYGVFGDKMYRYGDLNTGSGGFFLNFPDLPSIQDAKQKEYSLARSYAYQGGIVKHLDEPKFVFFSQPAGYVQIVEFKKEAIHEISQFNFTPPEGKVVFKVDAYVWSIDRNSLARFLGGASSKEFIYLLYSGKRFGDENCVKCKYILVFDWEGNRIKKIELDNDVYAITVDKESKELFAFTVNDETHKNEILFYKL